MYSIGEIISTYRKKKGLLQQDLADELAKEGITISYKAISNWERNLAEPSVTIFYKVCRILGITNMYEAYFGVNPAGHRLLPVAFLQAPDDADAQSRHNNS